MIELNEFEEKYPYFFDICKDVCFKSELLKVMKIMANTPYIQNICGLVGEGCPSLDELQEVKI